MSEPDHIARREDVLEALRQELLGPSPQGQEIDCHGEISFREVRESYGPYCQAESREEILMRDRPVKRYGVGVLSPRQVEAEEAVQGRAEPREGAPGEDAQIEDLEDGADLLSAAGQDAAASTGGRLENELDGDDYDYELSSVNAYRPSTMAVTFLAELANDSRVRFLGTGGRYERKVISVADGERTWWLRVPVAISAEFDGSALRTAAGSKLEPTEIAVGGAGPLDLHVVAYPRDAGQADQSLVTLCLVNRSDRPGPLDESCLFQTTFEVEVVDGVGDPAVLPYPEPGHEGDQEEESLDLLYRRYQTFAVGHGCAADWGTVDGGRTRQIIAQPLPIFEAPNITADVELPDGASLEISMTSLAGLDPSDDGFVAITQLIDEYAAWIGKREGEVDGPETANRLPKQYREAARRHLRECRDALERMERGVEFLGTNPLAMRAFRLANQAILLQQMRTRREPRRQKYDRNTRRLVFDEQAPSPDPFDPPEGRGKWRAFQIAFVLVCAPSVIDPASPDRELVELIWFPTGGGKTEAYLALTAFSLFFRRLRDPTDVGVDVLMRYTLRLLTAQQFQRASALICAMEVLRRENEDALGYEPFSIGIWLGSGVSPNRRSEAISALRALRRGDDENRFVLMKCPWCSAQMGALKHPPRTPSTVPAVVGYVEDEGTVKLKCPDPDCDFANELPVLVVDDDLYEHKPSLVIATVDKFAQLAWTEHARALFGLGPDGARTCSPPNLIIQDELHLISGPLGSMVGLYEGAVDALCRAKTPDPSVAPKIVSSTATIRRFEEQVHDLYARQSTVLFPPRGLDADDSFFASYARHPDGRLKPGRKFVGIHGAGLGSVQTAQVRTFATLLQAPATFSEVEKDPWWTLLVFFNSLRELGVSLSLLQSDIPDYLRVLQNRLGLALNQTRRLRDFLELTGRLQNHEVPGAMEKLEVETTSTGSTSVDACLASNIIEVGIDIDRLSLMVVVGQPKTTSQYIQVTGRVGRQWEKRPGLIATIYSPSRPRDRSHFEKFRSYHERLYAQVEPTSVTPFSPPVPRSSSSCGHGLVRAAGRDTGAGTAPLSISARSHLRDRDPPQSSRRGCRSG